MRIHNLYEDEAGQSHWRDIEVEWTEQTVGGPASSRLPASGVIFREMPVTYDLDWHVAPRRQYVVHLDGEFFALLVFLSVILALGQSLQHSFESETI